MRRLILAFSLLSSVICHPSSAHATQVQEVTTPGGLKAWLVEEHALPLVAVKIVFKDSGSAYDAPGKDGLAGMTAAMLLEGAGDKDSRAFNEGLENNAIQLNFGPDDDVFRASVESLSEHTEDAFSYLGLALTKPRFDDSAIERVRSQTLSAIAQQEKNPGYIISRQWEQLAFGSHPYGHPALGTKETIGSITKADLAAFASHYLTHENILISVVGDITPAELSRLLDAHLGALPAHYAPDVKLAEVRLPEAPKQLVIDNDIPQAMVLFGTNGLKRADPEYYAAYVMNQIIGGGSTLTSRLGQEIREKRGLAYGVDTQLSPKMHSASWRGGFATRNEKAGAALDILRATLKDFSEKGATDKELADAKMHLMGSFVLNLDSNGDIAAFLSSMQLNNLGRDYLDKRNSLIAKVTKEQVKAVAKKLTDPDHLLVVIVGKPVLKP